MLLNHSLGVHGSSKDVCLYCDVCKPVGGESAYCEAHTLDEAKKSLRRLSDFELASAVKARLSKEEWDAVVSSIRSMSLY